MGKGAMLYTFKAYQAHATCTLDPRLTKTDQLLMGCIGLAGEAGEVCEPIKKLVYHGKPFSREDWAQEIGDCLWYLAALADAQGLDLGEIAAGNIVKLRARYPERFAAMEQSK